MQYDAIIYAHKHTLTQHTHMDYVCVSTAGYRKVNEIIGWVSCQLVSHLLNNDGFSSSITNIFLYIKFHLNKYYQHSIEFLYFKINLKFMYFVKSFYSMLVQLIRI